MSTTPKNNFVSWRPSSSSDFLDPRGVRSDLLDRFRQVQAERDLPPLPNYAFEEETLYQTHRGPIRWIRKLLQPILKLFFNPNALIQALNVQSRLNTLYAEREAARHGIRPASLRTHAQPGCRNDANSH